MADGLYVPNKNAWLIQGANVVDIDTDNINASLVRSSTYTENLTTDDFYDDVTTPVQEADAFLSITVSGANVDATDHTFTAVAAGAALDQYVVWKDTAVDSTSRLIAFYDSFSAPTPNGEDINVTVNVSGLFDL